MSLFEQLNIKRLSLHEVKDDTTGRRKNIKVNIQDLQKKISKNPKLKNVGVRTTDTNTIKQSEVSKKAKVFTAKVNKQRIKKQFPGDKSGAYQATKTDIETRKGFSKNKPGGLKADERNPFVKRSVRKARVDDLGGNIYDQPKFSQKNFEKSLKDVSKKTPKTPSQPMVGGGGKAGSKPPSFKPKPFEKPSDPFAGSYDTSGQTKVKAMDTKAFKKTQPSDILKNPELSKTYGTKSFTDFSKKIKKLKTDVSKTASITPTVGVKQADVSRRAKKFSQNISNKAKLNKVQMRGGATNIPTGPTRPPKKYNIPADDRPGALAQGRDFPSKKSYDAKLEKQVKILRGKAANLRKKQIQVAKTTPTKGTPEYTARSTGVKKIGRRMRERTRTADALERSLKRQGTKGPTSMLPVVSGKGADELMPGMGKNSKMTYKQFYKAANVGAKQPPKVKSTPKPPPVNNTVNDTVKNVYKKSKVTSNYTGGFRNTAAFDKRVARMSRGFGGNRGKRALAGKVLRFAKKNPKTALIGGALALGTAYFGGKALSRRGDLNINKDFAKTTTIKNPSGKNVRFKYSNKKDKDGNPIYKDQASSYLTKDQKNKIGGTIPGGLTKFRTGQYTANYKSGGKVGGKINIDKNMRSSAFEKQLKKAEKGTGLFGRQRQQDKDFLRKYKNATRPTTV